MSQVTHKNFLRPKQVVGSCKLPIVYDDTHGAFNHEDIPQAKRDRKNEVKQFMRPKILSIEQPSWAKSTHLNQPSCDRRSMENFDHDRSRPVQYNFRAEVLGDKLDPPVDNSTKYHLSRQLPKEITKLENRIKADVAGIAAGRFRSVEELPNNPKLADNIPWNQSTEVILKHKMKRSNDFQAKSKVNTTKTVGRLREYQTPIDSTNSVLEEVRKQKAAGSFSTQHTVFQTVEEPVDRKTLVNRFAIEPTKKYVVAEHSGKWQYNEGDGRHMWSDTASYTYESPGDLVQVKNPDHYNYTCPNMQGNPSQSSATAKTLMRTSLSSSSLKTSAKRSLSQTVN